MDTHPMSCSCKMPRRVSVLTLLLVGVTVLLSVVTVYLHRMAGAIQRHQVELVPPELQRIRDLEVREAMLTKAWARATDAKDLELSAQIRHALYEVRDELAERRGAVR